MKSRTLLFGATSILGFTLAKLFPDSIVPCISPGNHSPLVHHWPVLHLDSLDWIRTTLSRYQPDVLLYGHAVCDVSKCEAHPDWAYDINVLHVHRLLDTLSPKTRLVYISSDHVFGGDGAYHEQSSPCPISIYGKSRVEAERLVLERPGSLIVRVGLAIGPSSNGRTGHLDWLRYRTNQKLPVTIVEDEYRSTVWAKDLALRVWNLTRTAEVGLRHIPATRAISRVKLAEYLFKTFSLKGQFNRERRHQRSYPHLGRVELKSIHPGSLAQPLPSILDQQECPDYITAFVSPPKRPTESL